METNYWGEFSQKDGEPVTSIKIKDSLECCIDRCLYDKLDSIGLIPNATRKDNVGESDYSKHIIQPWSIWIDYNLNAFDADIIKRVLRTKSVSGKTAKDARIEDYEKIIHICNERIRQLKCL